MVYIIYNVLRYIFAGVHLLAGYIALIFLKNIDESDDRVSIAAMVLLFLFQIVAGVSFIFAGTRVIFALNFFDFLCFIFGFPLIKEEKVRQKIWAILLIILANIFFILNLTIYL